VSTFVESLRRLYTAGKIELPTLDDLLARGKLTQEEYDYITGSA
jgi:hypothetical protein